MFADCPCLSKVMFSDSCALTEIGNAAFYETEWGAEFEYPGLHYVGKVVYQYQDDCEFYGCNNPVDKEIRRRSLG